MILCLKFGNRKIDFSLKYEKRKSLGIKVYPDGKVLVSAPILARESDIKEKIKKRAPWILKQMDHFGTYLPLTPPRRFISGETHLFLGRQYRLKVIPESQNIIMAYRGQLWMYFHNTKPNILQKRLNEWYKNKASAIFGELLDQIIPKFSRYQIPAPSLIIRLMTKRWGSCTPGGRIVLNLELIKAPKGCIEYVITHELCHMVFHNHGESFQQLLEKMMPHWRKWKTRLEYSLI
jgi:predicted metal-dependent hydrolase